VIPQAIWFVGLVLFMRRYRLRPRVSRLAARGETGAVAAAIGTRSAEEDVEAEIQSLKERQSRG
jgi:hypothetical protein